MENRTETLISAAKDLLSCGYQPVPVPDREKGPRTLGWQNARSTAGTVAAAFKGAGNIGVMCGEPSGWLIDIDLDCDEAVRFAPQFLPPTAMTTGRPGNPASHWWFVAEGAVTKKFKDPTTREMVVEYRSCGQQTLVGPSIHPESGGVYDPLEGEPAAVDAEHLLACVESLHRAVVVERYGQFPKERSAAAVSVEPRSSRSIPIEARLKRAAAYLDAMPPAIAHQGGHNITFAAATALVHGFELDPTDALRLLFERYNPKCLPPWSAKELEHKVEDAATKPHQRPRGWLHAS